MDPNSGESALAMSAQGGFAERVAEAGRLLLASPDPTMSFGALLVAFCLAVAWAQARGLRGRMLARLFPEHWRRDPSHGIDLLLFLLNWKVLGLVAVGLVLSFSHTSLAIQTGLNAWMGPRPEAGLPEWAVIVLSTAGLFLAYELAYWLTHALSHRVPWLWEFHRVHHEATVLSPLTVNRVHPVDTLLFANVTVLVTAPTHAVMSWLMGRSPEEMTLFGVNTILLLAVFLLVQLQHSHIWWPTTGWLGRVVMSPAHHQIHHSTNPVHFGSNLGGSLAIFDWMFGTLIVPERRRQRLTFGVEDSGVSRPHTLAHALLGPFRRILASAARAIRQRTGSPAPETPPVAIAPG